MELHPRGRRRREAGEGAISYGVIVLAVALVIGAFATLTRPDERFGPEVDAALCKVFNAGKDNCEAPRDQDLKPSACTTVMSTQTYGATITIAVFEIGKDLTFIRSTDSSGKVTVTAVHSTSLAIGTGIGAGLNLGKSVNVGVDADAKAKLKIGIGDSWVFNDQAEADGFIGQIQKAAKYEAGKGTFFGGIVKGFEAISPARVPDPHIKRLEFELSGSASVQAGIDFGPPAWDDEGRPKTGPDTRGDNKGKPDLRGYVSVDPMAKAVLEKDKRTGETSVTIDLTGGAKAGGAFVIDNAEVRGQVAGSLKLTSDRDGKLTKLTLTRTVIVNGRLTATTTELPITTEAERESLRRYLRTDRDSSLSTPLRLTWDDMAPTRPPGPDATPLQRLLHAKGRTQKVDYAYSATDLAYGAQFKLGLKLGIGVTIQKRDQSAVKADYLGASGPDGTRQWRPFKECRS